MRKCVTSPHLSCTAQRQAPPEWHPRGTPTPTAPVHQERGRLPSHVVIILPSFPPRGRVSPVNTVIKHGKDHQERFTECALSIGHRVTKAEEEPGRQELTTDKGPTQTGPWEGAAGTDETSRCQEGRRNTLWGESRELKLGHPGRLT